MYAAVNLLFGDIVKVTPSSKVVGDMTLFMMANNLTPEQVLDPGAGTGVSGIGGGVSSRVGSASRPAVFPKRCKRKCCAVASRCRNAREQVFHLRTLRPRKSSWRKSTSSLSHRPTFCSHLLYPRVFADFVEHQRKYSDTSILPTEIFFYGMQPGEETSIEIEPGKTLIIKFLTIGDAHEDGRRLVFFELNGQPREVLVVDKQLVGKGATIRARPKAEAGNPLHVAAPMPGAVVGVAVAIGEQVAVGQKLLDARSNEDGDDPLRGTGWSNR